MSKHLTRRFSVALALCCAGLTSVASGAGGADGADSTHSGRSQVYRNLNSASLEDVSTPDRMLSLVANPDSAAPTAIWTMLEHGERVECMPCIPYVSNLLYAPSAKTREISAWWLRKRIFGVFGPGEAYEQTLHAIADQKLSPSRRAYAANALGEFLLATGIEPVAQALLLDGSAEVRLAAANALVRLNSEGPNQELGDALSDPDEAVRLAALSGATRINVFSHVEQVVALISDPSPQVRRRAAQTLGAFKSRDAVVGLIALSSVTNESDAGVRAAAVWALGQVADPAAREAVLAAREDADSSVRDAADIAALRL